LQTADKKSNPLYATQGSPGMGKSALIDLLSSLSWQQVRELSPAGASDEFCQWVVDSVHVSIDFNGFQTPSDHELGNVERIISVRLLHRYSESREFTFGFPQFIRFVIC
jgi:broad-specificity NMP kinase